MSRRLDLGVDWHLPAKKGGYATRRFATTTVASSDLITLLAEDGSTWSQVAERILFDPEAKAVATAFVDAGHGSSPASTMLTSPKETPDDLPRLVRLADPD